MKRTQTIRSRMLFAALLPVTLLALVLSMVFLGARVSDNAEAHTQRARALIRQTASASEYGIFAGNTSQLRAVASGTLRNPDVRSVVITNARGEILVELGKRSHALLTYPNTQEALHTDAVAGIDVLTQPVLATPLVLDDAFAANGPEPIEPPALLGQVVMEVSREPLLRRDREMLLVGLFVTVISLLLGGALAVRLGASVVNPVMRVSRMVERLGRGELAARADVRPDDPLRELQIELNRMASRLEWSREEMAQRIASATAELREKKEEAESATEAKSRFLAAASHDLRQPTHALGMFVARLAQMPGNPEMRQLVGNLNATVHAMQDLLDGLLDISQLDAGVVQTQVRPLPVNSMFDALRDAFQGAAQDKGLRLRIRPTDQWAMSDPVLLQRMVLNLVSNAVRYTGSGTVFVCCRRTLSGQHLRIEVWDSGVGIPSDQHGLIFREFYQVGNAERDRAKGMGLGLSIVDRTARLLGHGVTLRSGPGCGSRFAIELPCAEPLAHGASPDVPELSVLTGLTGVRILVIEDDTLASRGLVGLLSSWGCVLQAVDGRDAALAAIKNAPPDMIISDYRLPRGDNGLTLIADLRAAAGGPIPACLMSGDTDELLIHQAQMAGLTLLHKPVRPAKLRSLIRHLVGAA